MSAPLAGGQDCPRYFARQPFFDRLLNSATYCVCTRMNAALPGTVKRNSVLPCALIVVSGAVKGKATMEGERVVVSAEAVPAPVQVRFGWDQLAQPNLANKEGFPASPFNTAELLRSPSISNCLSSPVRLFKPSLLGYTPTGNTRL